MGISNSFGMLGPNHAQDDEGAADIANHKIIMTEENGPCYVFK